MQKKTICLSPNREFIQICVLRRHLFWDVSSLWMVYSFLGKQSPFRYQPQARLGSIVILKSVKHSGDGCAPKG